MSLTLEDYQARDAAVAGMERALIATVLANPDQIHHAELLLPQDFASPSHQTLWSEIVAFHRDGQFSLQAVFQSLQSKGLIDTLGSEFGPERIGVGYLNEMMSYAAPQSSAFFAKAVLGNATKRAVRRSAALLAADCDDPNMSAEELLDKAESDILALRRGHAANGVAIGSLLDLFDTVMEKRRSNTFVPALAPHIIPIKSILKFFEEQDYPLIAARPGEGKSSLIRFEAFNEAMEGRPVTIINLENGELEYARYLVALRAGIDADLLRNPSVLHDNQMQDIKNALRELKSIPLRIVTLGAPSVEEVAREYVTAVREGAKSVWVDYIQLINNRVDNKNLDVTISSTRLRGLSMKHHVPLIVASQMSREIVKRGVEAEPELSDLRDSGSLEQDATHVLFPRLACGPNPTADQLREFPENRNEEGRVIVVPIKVYVRKNRNGSIGVTNPFKWNKSTNNFEALTDEPARAPRPPRARQPVQEVLEAI